MNLGRRRRQQRQQRRGLERQLSPLAHSLSPPDLESAARALARGLRDVAPNDLWVRKRRERGLVHADLEVDLELESEQGRGRRSKDHSVFAVATVAAVAASDRRKR